LKLLREWWQAGRHPFTALGFELGDAGVQRLHLRQQFSMRSSLPAICAMSTSVRAGSDATSWAPSLLGESISLCGMASVNQLAALRSTPQTRVTTPQRHVTISAKVALLRCHTTLFCARLSIHFIVSNLKSTTLVGIIQK
jgi:hypothetical protein